jgi:energy-coupling factor transport system permease protein
VFAYIPILVPLFATTIQRAEQLSFAIDARAYGTGKGRTSYKQLEFKRSDFVAGGFAIIFVFMILIIRMYV